jgi:hypothetical protein
MENEGAAEGQAPKSERVNLRSIGLRETSFRMTTWNPFPAKLKYAKTLSNQSK